MSKKNVTLFLIVFHFITIGAVLFRLDTFPLTWVPMYSQFHGETDLVVPVGDKAIVKKGFEIETLSGEIEYIRKEDLNLPKAAFRRIFYERSFGKGPPKHLRERAGLNPLSNYVFDQFYPDPAVSIDWDNRILDMMNKTLNREAHQPDYIVKAIAVSDFTYISREARRAGDLSDLNIKRKTAIIEYSERY